jgi:hypothetical protein
MMTFVGLACFAVVGATWAYLLRRRRDVMTYHDIDTPRVLRQREGGV